MTDEELVKACQAQNPKAQNTLYNRYAGRLMGVCLRYANDSSEAEDIFQEAFIKIFSHIDQVRPETLSAWIKRIVINTAINHYRQQKKHHEIDEINDVVENEYFDTQTNAIDNMSQEELLNLVQKLPKGYKMVFNLYAIEGYAHKEIGEIMNITEANSKNIYAKAKKSLQKMIVSTNTIKL
jgi:RNA polymerase sigma factor (sigma-70 family)